MKPAHTLARLLHDLKKHVRTVNPGSEPFQSGLKSIEKTAWELLLLRNIEWTALQQRTEYAFRVSTYVATPDGDRLTHRTPERKPKPVVLNAHQREVHRVACKTIAQYARTAEWVMERYEDALECELNGRTRLRCLTGRASFETLVKTRFKEIEQMKAGAAPPSGQLADFVERHGQVHIYRDTMYATEREAQAAMRDDSLALPVDHDLIVDFYERAFIREGFNEDVFEELTRYLRSQDHREALKVSEKNGVEKGKLSRHDQIVALVATAERKLAALSDPLPPAVYTKLSVSKNFFVTIMRGHPRTKDGVRLALRQKMYELCPSKRPKKRREVEAVIEKEPSTLPPSMDDNHPANCNCIRHGGAQ